ncbi:MAG TPA: hypothetical protein VFX16_28175 [Pseudonocardiaceae bacterium]|nr:hypothetical protein [Pseudonocardiaceae bacterium]
MRFWSVVGSVVVSAGLGVVTNVATSTPRWGWIVGGAVLPDRARPDPADTLVAVAQPTGRPSVRRPLPCGVNWPPPNSGAPGCWHESLSIWQLCAEQDAERFGSGYRRLAAWLGEQNHV